MASKNYHLVKNKKQEGGYLVPVVTLRSSPIYGYPVLGRMPINLKIMIGSNTFSFDIPGYLARSLLHYMYQVKNRRSMSGFNGIDVVIGRGGLQYRDKMSPKDVSIIFGKLADLSEGKKPKLHIDDNLRTSIEKVKNQLEQLLSQNDDSNSVPL